MASSEDFWKSIAIVITAVGGVIVLILKELRTSVDIRKSAEATQRNTEATQHTAEETAKIREDLDAGLIESRKVAAARLRKSRLLRLETEERFKRAEAERIEAERVAAVRLAISETKRITAEQQLHDSQVTLEKLSANGVPVERPQDQPSQPENQTPGTASDPAPDASVQ